MKLTFRKRIAQTEKLMDALETQCVRIQTTDVVRMARMVPMGIDR